jgi:F-type H+-transporting ATPase subunit b
MFKKIIFKTLIFCFALVSIAQSSESGGMPQLNPEFWVSQIFWLILTFGTMFVVLSKLILPKISKNLEIRKSQILENIETAEKQREQSENKIKEYEKLIFESKIEAKNYFSEIRQKVLGDIAKKKQVLDNQIEKELKDVEKEINELKGKAPEKINKIAIETSTDLIKHLIGAEVNSSSISAIVEDISIKNKDKYYGV